MPRLQAMETHTAHERALQGKRARPDVICYRITYLWCLPCTVAEHFFTNGNRRAAYTDTCQPLHMRPIPSILVRQVHCSRSLGYHGVEIRRDVNPCCLAIDGGASRAR